MIGQSKGPDKKENKENATLNIIITLIETIIEDPHNKWFTAQPKSI
jgi:hypothetical protein